MPSLSYYLQRAGEQPWQETLQQGRTLLTETFRRKTQPTYDRYFRTEPSRQDILTRCGFATPEEMAAHFKDRQSPVFPEPFFEDDPTIDRLDPSVPIPWHTDRASGYNWDPLTHYRNVPLSPGKGIDIK